MTVLFRCLALCLFFIAVPALSQEEGKLGEFEEEVKKDEQAEQSESSSDNESVAGSLIKLLFNDTFLSLAIGLEKEVLDDGSVSYSIPLARYSFTDYPYATPGKGLYTTGGNDNASSVVSVGYFNESGRLFGYSAHGRFSPTPFLSFEARYNGLYEEMFDFTARLSLYSVFLNYHSIRNEFFTFRWGIGMKGLVGNHNLTGIGFNTGAELYPFRPVSLQLEFSTGKYSEFLGTLNIHVNRTAFFAGWQHLQAGDVVISGLIGGVQVYF
jgi:hypothetical protein